MRPILLVFMLAACGRSEQTVSPGDDGTSGIDDEASDPGDDSDEAGDDQAGEDDPADVEEEEDPVEEEEDDPPSDYTYDEDEVVPLLSLDEVAEAMTGSMNALMAGDPFLVLQVFDEVIDDGDEDRACPYWNETYYELYGYDYWYGGCTSDSDIYYDGYIYGRHYGSYTSGSYRYNDYGWWYGDWAADYPDGQRWDLSGYFYAYDYTYLPYSYRYNSINFVGDVSWTGAEHADAWFGGGASVDYVLYAMDYPGYGTYVNLSGGLSSLDGDATSVHFDDFYIGTGKYSDCPEEPAGTVSIRDEDGEWYQAIFDGPAYQGAEVFPPDCDGCGEVWFRGERLGSVCPDFSVFTDWEERPW